MAKYLLNEKGKKNGSLPKPYEGGHGREEGGQRQKKPRGGIEQGSAVPRKNELTKETRGVCTLKKKKDGAWEKGVALLLESMANR